jgi:hypothetical protein
MIHVRPALAKTDIAGEFALISPGRASAKARRANALIDKNTM